MISKEEKVIQHANEVLVQLHTLYQGGELLDEFEILLKEYKKLYRREQKVIKMSDTLSGDVMSNNDHLHENLNYTIKTARDKLLLNVTEHRKTKENIQQYIERIKELENEIILLKSGSTDLNMEIATNPNQTYKEVVKENVNPLELKNETISKLIKKSMENNKNKNLIMACVTIDNFNEISNSSKISSLKNFLNSIYKYLKNSFTKNEIIFHLNNEKFYILVNSADLEEFSSNLNKLNIRKLDSSLQIFFKFGVTKLLENDNVFSFLSRCNQALEEAKVLNVDLHIK